jgi:hypothetical protein
MYYFVTFSTTPYALRAMEDHFQTIPRSGYGFIEHPINTSILFRVADMDYIP